MNLLNAALKLARETDLAKTRICRATGLKRSWYNRFISGEIDDPGVKKVQRVHDYLKRRRPRK